MITTADLTNLSASRALVKNKPFVSLYVDGEYHGRAGGASAGRAQAVLVAKWADEDFVRFWGVRGNLPKAQAEARNMLRTEMVTRDRHTGRKIVRRLSPPEWAVAVPVTDA